jgi:hypothetical protein
VSWPWGRPRARSHGHECRRRCVTRNRAQRSRVVVGGGCAVPVAGQPGQAYRSALVLPTEPPMLRSGPRLVPEPDMTLAARGVASRQGQRPVRHSVMPCGCRSPPFARSRPRSSAQVKKIPDWSGRPGSGLIIRGPRDLSSGHGGMTRWERVGERALLPWLGLAWLFSVLLAVDLLLRASGQVEPSCAHQIPGQRLLNLA